MEYNKYVMHKTTGAVGVADIPDWINFDEQPPRSFTVRWHNQWYGGGGVGLTSTSATTPITKEVADILIGLNDAKG